MSKPAILVVTGASGAGKTTAVSILEQRVHPDVECFYFDRIGVPPREIMERDQGGPEGWQAQATHKWISQLATRHSDRISVLDGQTRPSFVLASVATVSPVHIRIVLLHCNPAVRQARLTARGQPDLATEQMDRWAVYLQDQAEALGMPVIDTSHLTESAMADALEAEIETLRLEVRSA